MTRPLLDRAAREACPHPQTSAIRSDLPNSYGGRQWCRECGVFFLSESEERDGIDWTATKAADREDMERMGQGRLL